MEKLVVHQVGNKQREESNFISNDLLQVDESMTKLLIKYLMKPFRQNPETYHFVHSVNVQMNEMNIIAKKLFEDKGHFYEGSKEILEFLYQQSNHPHIKSGDLFVCFLNDIQYEDELVEGIGIFKAESKDAFLKVSERSGQIQLKQEEGINTKKLDKGAVILNVDPDNGYRVLSVDNNSYDAEYWLYRFLNVDYIKDDSYATMSYMNMCESFSEEVIKNNGSKKDQLEFLNQSIDYFEANERIDTNEFKETLFPTEELKTQFQEFKTDYENNTGVVIADEFEISKPAFKKQKKNIKSNIKLDTDIQIKLDFRNPEASRQYLETGFDEQRGMKYYKIYFNEELDD